MTIAMSGCQTTAILSPQATDNGVSKELADYRRQEITGLEYNLNFNIPEQKAAPVEGDVTVKLTIGAPQQLVFDFKAEARQLKSVYVNGREADCTVSNEHIILPKQLTHKGVNTVKISFTAGNQSLNRNNDFLYTLLVPDRARTLFPCFDQPNLKAVFTLKLDVPAQWKAVSNTYIQKETTHGDRKTIAFAATEPLSTYLFSFVAGRLMSKEYNADGRKISAYYRETDPDKVAQLDTIFKQVAAALRWQEEFTGIKYPFAKYDFIILPGFQYGGMEHTGATLYNDNQMFLGKNATPDEELSRTQLIAHETSHMWFGDYVTMDWFDDVWTKEVFANYFAAQITQPLFPDINHRLNWMKTYTAAALSEDRTQGTTSIRQPLDDLQDAGLIYGQIVYNKAPVMMEKIVELMGKDKFREGIQEYLRTYAYGNATWDDLINILDSKTTHDLEAFSKVWVNQKGMPYIIFKPSGNTLTVSQKDPYGRGLTWPQQFNVRVCGADTDSVVAIDLSDSVATAAVPFEIKYVVPNTDGRAYGLLTPDEGSMEWIIKHWQDTPDETERQALLMLLNENYQSKKLNDDTWVSVLLNGLRRETNPLIASTMAGCLSMPMKALNPERKKAVETELYELSSNHKTASCRTQLMRVLMQTAESKEMTERLLQIWKERSASQLNENDYTTMAYELAVRLPQQSEEILSTQRSRITDPDRLRQFDFIARAAVADTVRLDSLFSSLLKAENRRTEPWAATALAYLNHPARGGYSVKYIRPALEAMKEVQKTGDIFFPRNWAGALLRNHTDYAAYREVRDFFLSHHDYPQLLKNKILQAAYPLYRKYAPE